MYCEGCLNPLCHMRRAPCVQTVVFEEGYRVRGSLRSSGRSGRGERNPFWAFRFLDTIDMCAMMRITYVMMIPTTDKCRQIHAPGPIHTCYCINNVYSTTCTYQICSWGTSKSTFTHRKKNDLSRGGFLVFYQI